MNTAQQAWVLIDETGGATTSDGSKLTPQVLADIAEAVETQINAHLVPNAQGQNVTVRAGSGPEDVNPGESAFAILPTIPVDGAIAYHDRDGNGVPVAFDAITASDTLTGPGNSLSVAVSHEILEANGNPACNLYADSGQAFEVARERSDAVESQSYPMSVSSGGIVNVSNFVLDSFFDPGAPPPYDYMTLAGMGMATPPTAPFVTPPGGNYQDERDVGGNERQVTAKHTHETSDKRDTPMPGSRRARRADKDAHPQSRASRRRAWACTGRTNPERTIRP